MTDFASGTDAMGDGRSTRHGPPRAEYTAYFALIFAATLPLALITWALTAARQLRLPAKGPFARAWTQASIITPRIFSA